MIVISLFRYSAIVISAIKFAQNLFKNQLIIRKPGCYAICQLIRFLVHCVSKHTNLHYTLHCMLAYIFDLFVWTRL